ncbi:MAG: hypothetical protein AAF141_15620 [Pseudomonadota bacterium]
MTRLSDLLPSIGHIRFAIGPDRLGRHAKGTADAGKAEPAQMRIANKGKSERMTGFGALARRLFGHL